MSSPETRSKIGNSITFCSPFYSKFYIIVKRQHMTTKKSRLFMKEIFKQQGKRLIKLYHKDYAKIIKDNVKIVTSNYTIDFSSIDKILQQQMTPVISPSQQANNILSKQQNTLLMDND